MITRRLIIHGVVQGVGFRWSLAREADYLGITGWVRNRRDGTVEAMIEGEAAMIAHLIEWAQHGPPSAQVSQVIVESASGGFTGFEQRPTA